MGFADVGVNGSTKIPTPHIDQLAAEGINFTDGHCPAATCSGSRFAMLTGHLATRRGVVILGPDSRMPITEDDYTLAHVFRDAGYATAVVGKWHLGVGSPGTAVDWNGAVKPGPLEIGFDYSFLLPNTNDRVPCVYLEGHRVVNLDPADPISLGKRISPDQTSYPDARQTPEAMTYYPSSHGHNHSVIHGIGRIGTMFGGKSALWNDETMGDEFLHRADAWMTKHREANPDQPFFLYFPSHMIHVPRAPHPRFHGKTDLGYRGDHMVEFDATVGAVRKLLQKHGVAENTMTIFSSDNGPVYDDGYQDGTVTQTSTKETDQGHDGSGPYRGGKYQIYEGGTRVPFIVHWPAGIAEPSTSKAMVSHIDFIASFASMLGVEVPQGAAPDSQNRIAALLGKDPVGSEWLVEEGPGDQLAVRRGEWKILRPRKARGKQGPAPGWELYNLAEDIGEQNDLMKEYPEMAEQLQGLAEQLLEGATMADLFGQGVEY